MKRSFGITWILGLFYGAMFALLLTIAGLYGIRQWEQYRDAETFGTTDAATDALLVAIDHLTNERGLTQAALLAAGPAKPEQLAAIGDRRDKMNAAMARARAGLAGGHVAVLGAMNAKLERIDTMRREAEGAIKADKAARPEALVKQWYPAATEAIAAMRAVWNDATYDNSGRDPLVGRFNEIKYLAGELRESSGRERALIGAGVAGTAPVNADGHRRALADQARVETSWRRLRELTPDSGQKGIADAVAAADRLFFGQYVQKRNEVLTALVAGQPAGLDSKQWAELSNPALASFVAIRDAAIAASLAHADAMRAAALQRLVVLGALGLAAMLLVVLAVTVILRRVTNPIQAMTAAMQRLANKDWDVVVPARERRDEIGAMAAAVEVFKQNGIENEKLQREAEEARHQQEQLEIEKRRLADENARETERKLKELEERMLRTAEEQQAAETKLRAEAEKRRSAEMNALADAFETTVKRVVESVSSAANQMQSSSAAMTATAEETSRQSSAVASASEEASSNVQTVATAAEELSSSIQEITRQVAESSRMSKQAVDQARSTGTAVDGLAQAAQKIGDVVKLINDIASQTNLLALNATIEAARAGEAGKGFAVVASEVKSLATQTARATDEIARQIDSVQSATGQAVSAIQGIGASIEQVNEVASTIAAAVEEQGAATLEISRNVQQAATGTHEVNRNVATITRAAGEVGTAAAQVNGASTDLARQAETLRTEVDRFIAKVRAA